MFKTSRFFLIWILLWAPHTLWSQEGVKRLVINSTPSPKLPEPPRPSLAESNTDLEREIKEGPFSVLANPKFKKFLQVITDKKMVQALNVMGEKEKMKFMLIAQCVLILLNIMFRSWFMSNTRGFFSILMANLWISGLHVFLALVVLPRFIYGPHYFQVITELYKLVTFQG